MGKQVALVDADLLGSAEIIRANALDLPLADKSVDLIVSSPPYFALRSYQDGGEHYGGQIGAEDSPGAFVEALWAVMSECWRVLKDEGSCWFNLGDKYSGSGGNNQSGVGAKAQKAGPRAYNKVSAGIRAKSLMGLPWRFANGCIDGMAGPCVKNHEHVGRHPAYLPSERCEGARWILRAEVIWSKPNGLPESVQDRVRRNHEQWFHFVKSPRYFSAVDEIREPHFPQSIARAGRARLTPRDVPGQTVQRRGETEPNPLGKLPGSVWTIATEPLKVPEELGIDHFAAFPSEWPRRIILGWSPSGICVECGQGRRPVRERGGAYDTRGTGRVENAVGRHGTNHSSLGKAYTHQIVGYACTCKEPISPTTQAVVLDPFGGTGTTALVAKALGRKGITVDLSADYCRLAEWRTNDEKSLAKVQSKTRRKATRPIQGKPKVVDDGIVQLAFD